MKVLAIVQARMGSTRLPNKVMLPIVGVPMIELLLRRLKLSKELNEIVVATTNDKLNIPLISHVTELGFSCEIGSEDDVLSRYLLVARKHNAEVIVRITGDCPVIDPNLVDDVICEFKSGDYDYFSNVHPATYPDGLDVEIFKLESLEIANLKATDDYDREHVTPYFWRYGKFRCGSMVHDEDLSKLRWTVDEHADYLVMQKVYEYFYPRIHFSWSELLSLQIKKPELFQFNQNLFRNEGSTMSNGQKLWRRAKNIIPGGNMLLSKRSEMFLPDQWPSYFSKSKGCKVWDLDQRQYIDMSIMGVGTNILGYGHPDVDKAVRKTVAAGNMSTLNCPEEVYLAEKLIELHPWAEMVRFARSGGEANAIAIRIARAASGKDKVAVCGYHGWHDWYLAANLGSDANLDGHLLPGLDPKGVPRNLKNSVFTFEYNKFEDLLSLVNEQDIGVIKMEVVRDKEPKDDFLSKVRKLATERNIVLIFDECTSGFRETFGGLHKKYDVDPDMAVFGKALGNGYGITAIIGKKCLMEEAQSTFISSTFWTERIGPSAALAALRVMESIKSWQLVTKTGSEIRQGWSNLAEKYSLNIRHFGLAAMPGFNVVSPNALAYKTLITQEMLLKGYLAGNSIYVCIDHTERVVKNYFNALEPIFKIIQECEDGREVMPLLKGPVCHSGFKRLN